MLTISLCKTDDIIVSFAFFQIKNEMRKKSYKPKLIKIKKFTHAVCRVVTKFSHML